MMNQAEEIRELRQLNDEIRTKYDALLIRYDALLDIAAEERMKLNELTREREVAALKAEWLLKDLKRNPSADGPSAPVQTTRPSMTFDNGRSPQLPSAEAKV